MTSSWLRHSNLHSIPLYELLYYLMGFLVLIIFFNGILGVKKNVSDNEEDIGKYSSFEIV